MAIEGSRKYKLQEILSLFATGLGPTNPGVDPGQPLIATTRASLEEHWTPLPASTFKAGDALARTG